MHGIRVFESVLIASAGSNELEQQPLVPHPSWTFGLLIGTVASPQEFCRCCRFVNQQTMEFVVCQQRLSRG